MKFRKIYLLYIATLLPGFMLIGALLAMDHDVSLINHTFQPLSSQTNLIVGREFTKSITSLFVILVKYYVLLLAISATALVIRIFTTKSGWISILIHIVISIILGILLCSFAFAIAEFIGRFFGWSFFSLH